MTPSDALPAILDHVDRDRDASLDPSREASACRLSSRQIFSRSPLW
jgi:hypothetical protein